MERLLLHIVESVITSNVKHQRLSTVSITGCKSKGNHS